MKNNTEQTIMVETNVSSGRKKMIVANPLNGQSMDLMPLFYYMESIKDGFEVNAAARPQMVVDIIDDLIKNQISFANEALELLEDSEPLGVLSVKALYSSIENIITLKRAFGSMTIY